MITPNDPYYIGYDKQWQLTAMDCERAWAIHTGKNTTKICVSDTGARPHIDIQDSQGNSRLVATLNTYDGGSAEPIVTNFHGMECMGAIGATGNNGKGVAGVHWNCLFVGVKISEPLQRGWGSPQSVRDGIMAGGDYGCRSLNLSWGLGDIDTQSQPAQYYQDAIDYSFDRGCLTFIIAGNQGVGNYLNQDQLKRCVIVGGSTRDGHRDPCSNFGRWVTVVAPLGGVGSSYYSYRSIDYGPRVSTTTRVWGGSSYVDGYTQDFWGTSAATPLALGAEALSDIADNLTPYQRLALVKYATNKLDARWHDETFSAFGQVSAYKMVITAQLALPGAAPRPTVITATPAHNSSAYLGCNTPILFEALVFDENPVDSVSLYLDGSETPYQTVTAEPYIFEWTPNSSGIHTYQFKAASLSGVGTSGIATLNVLPAVAADPFVGIISHRSGDVVSGTIEVAAAASMYATLVQDNGLGSPWYTTPYIQTLDLRLKQNGIVVASLPQVTTGGIWGQLTIPSSVSGLVTLEATAVTSNGLTTTSTEDLVVADAPPQQNTATPLANSSGISSPLYDTTGNPVMLYDVNGQPL